MRGRKQSATTKRKKDRIRIPPEFFAMTLEDVARAIGSDKKAVAMVQATALRKLRARPKAFRRLLELSAMRQKLLAGDPGDPAKAQ